MSKMSEPTVASPSENRNEMAGNKTAADLPDSGNNMSESLPATNAEALEYLKSIEESELDKLMFTDSLVTVTDTGRELGEFTVTVEHTRRLGTDCFLVHANSHGFIDNVPCGTSITAHVSRQLETLEQQQHEYIKLDNHPLDKKTSIFHQDDKYLVNKVVTQGEEVQKTSQTYTLEEMNGFISEASNLLLQRLMIKQGLQDKTFSFLTFDTEAELSISNYKFMEQKKLKIAKEKVQVAGIERTIVSRRDLPTTWQSYFLDDGHLASRVQVGSPMSMKLIQMPMIIEDVEDPPKPVFPKKPLNWEEDMQLYSKFLDRKDELKGDHSVYIKHHPELRALLADFLQFLLLRKPDNVIAFAADYFASFSSTIPSGASFATSKEDRYRQSGSPLRHKVKSPFK